MGKPRYKIREYIRHYYEDLYSGVISPSVAVPSGQAMARQVGYPNDLIQWLSEQKFFWKYTYPCGYLVPYVSIKDGTRILNMGSGIGLDSFSILFRLQSASTSCCVKIVNVDVVSSVVDLGAKWASSSGHLYKANIFWICADGLYLPFLNESFDTVILNGVFNLFPNRHSLLREISRVMRKTGIIITADIFSRPPIPNYVKKEADAWAWCIAGALREEALLSLLRDTDFKVFQWLEQERIDETFYRGIFTARF